MSKKNRKLEKFKPFNISRKKFDESYNVIFDEFGDAYEKDEGYRPIIIFYDERERKYGYLKGRGRYYTNGVEREIKKGEVIIKKADNNGLFTKSTYVDCSQIFWMDKDELESLVDFTSIININTKAFKEDNIKIIINGIKDCILQNPPYLSILNVYIDKNEQKTKAKSFYLCEEKLIERKIFDLVKNQNKEKKKRN